MKFLKNFINDINSFWIYDIHLTVYDICVAYDIPCGVC